MTRHDPSQKQQHLRREMFEATKDMTAWCIDQTSNPTEQCHRLNTTIELASIKKANEASRRPALSNPELTIHQVNTHQPHNDRVDRAANRPEVFERDTMGRSHIPRVSRGCPGFGPTFCYASNRSDLFRASRPFHIRIKSQIT